MVEIDFTQLHQEYENWKESSILHRLFKPIDIEQILLNLSGISGFDLKILGESVEGRNIYRIKWGNGPIKILLWSQMHGDEPTATMAFMDLFNFLKTNDQYTPIKQLLAEKLELHFIPMLNPDGAARYQRRNALDIDINRDALRLQTPEGRILMAYSNQFNPSWAFNMHDQRKYYTVGQSLETATISFLAPSFNVERSVNETRANAMKVIAEMQQCLSEFIPGKIAKYTDKFYPRSFGDNFQKSGVSSILVESGGMKGDPEKQYIRKLHFLLLIQGLYSIANGDFTAQELQAYHEIPENTEFLFDLVIRNTTLRKNGKEYIVDLAFKTEEIAHEEHWDFYHQSSLVDLGDLSTHHGYQELDGTELTVVPGKMFPKIYAHPTDLNKNKGMEILNGGYTDVRVKELPSDAPLLGLPVRLVPENDKGSFDLLVGRNASLFLQQDGKNRYAVVNGFLVELA